MQENKHKIILHFAFVGADHVTTSHEDGKHTISCKDANCLLQLSNVETDYAVGYTASGNTITVTCSAKGIKTYTCSHDSSHTYTEDVDALGHKYDNACDSECNTCGEERTPVEHIDADENNACDECGAEIPKDGLSGGAIAGIVIGSVATLGGGGFALWWFVFRKKRII